jgi:hypothetical protein
VTVFGLVGELKVIGVFLAIVLAAMVYIVAEFLWSNRRRR